MIDQLVSVASHAYRLVRPATRPLTDRVIALLEISRSLGNDPRDSLVRLLREEIAAEPWWGRVISGPDLKGALWILENDRPLKDALIKLLLEDLRRWGRLLPQEIALIPEPAVSGLLIHWHGWIGITDLRGREPRVRGEAALTALYVMGFLALAMVLLLKFLARPDHRGTFLPENPSLPVIFLMAYGAFMVWTSLALRRRFRSPEPGASFLVTVAASLEAGQNIQKSWENAVGVLGLPGDSDPDRVTAELVHRGACRTVIAPVLALKLLGKELPKSPETRLTDTIYTRAHALVEHDLDILESDIHRWEMRIAVACNAALALMLFVTFWTPMSFLFD